MSDNIFVVLVNIGEIRRREYYDKMEFPEYVRAINFEHERMMAFVIEEFIETRSMYTVVFEDRVFKLQKQPNKDRWEKDDGMYTFHLCKTAKDTWNALRGFLYALVEERKTLLKKMSKGTSGQWGPEKEENADVTDAQ